MNTLLIRLSNFSTRAVYAIYGIFAAILISNYFTDFEKENYGYILTGVLLLNFIGTFVLRKGSLYLEKIKEAKCFFVLIVICFAVKFIWVCSYRIEPFVDYATFYYTAESLSENYVINNRYVALFPHIFGYSLFLSIFFKLFGANFMIPPIINVVLSTISMALIYFICKKIGGLKTAITGSILWILFPSQTIYNMFALSEPLYGTLLLSIWAVMIIIFGKLPNTNLKNLLFYSVSLALMLTLMNMVRPIAAVPIIALIVWLLLIDTGHIGNKKMFFKKSVHIVAVILCYFVFSSAANHYITVRLGEDIASTPGYNIYVGFNKESLGKWNQADAELLLYYNAQAGWTADDAQKQMLKEAKKRLQSNDIDFPQLFYDKFLIFLDDDSAAVSYAKPALEHKVRYIILSNVFYYFLIVSSFLGVLVAFRSKNKSPAFFICLYAIGLTLAQMLTEVAARYHYSATISIVILAALGINHVFNMQNAVDYDKQDT